MDWNRDSNSTSEPDALLEWVCILERGYFKVNSCSCVVPKAERLMQLRDGVAISAILHDM